MSPRKFDCCVHHDWAAREELVEYLPKSWQEWVGTPGRLPHGLGGKPITIRNPYHNPAGDTLPSAELRPQPLGAAGTAWHEASQGGVVSPQQLSIDLESVLCYGSGLYVAADNDPHLAVAMCAAMNTWTVTRWLDTPAVRGWGSIIVPSSMPDEAAKEVRRLGAHPRMVQVLMCGNGLGKPFGHPIYHPIYKAAAALDLAVAIHVGGDAPTDTSSQTAAIGPPATYAEYAALSAQPLAAHLASLIVSGAFQKYPSLRVILFGGGLSWCAPLMWRFDASYRSQGRDAPWLKAKPSSVFREHFFLGTYQMEVAAPKLLSAALQSIDGMKEMLCLASGQPAADSIDRQSIEASLPADWVAAVTTDNPLRLYGSRVKR